MMAEHSGKKAKRDNNDNALREYRKKEKDKTKTKHHLPFLWASEYKRQDK